jgi:nitroreductase
MELSDVIRARGSVKRYDPEFELSDQDLRSLFELVVRSPSSFNLQHWRFVAVRDQGLKDQIMAAAWGQPHLGQASVDVVICGKLPAHEDAAEIYGSAPEDVAAKMVPMIGGLYGTNPQLQRDEAIRSGSLAGMTLMYVAQDMGFATCPMIGFDAAKVSELLGIPDDHVPVMIVTLGKGATDARPTERLDVERVVKLDRFDGAGLG